MEIKKFKAQNYRNIDNCEIEFFPGVNLLYGDNAQGKTNAIEAIYTFARGKSFRASEEKEAVKFGADGFHISIEYENEDGKNTLEYSFFGREKRIKKNGYKIEKVKEMVGNFKAVLFYPDDLYLVKGSPEERRAFLNIAASQCYKPYISYYANYKKALENRNYILKNASKGLYYDENELISWSYYMAENASFIHSIRSEYIKKLELYSKEIIKEISDGKEDIKFIYKSDISKSEKREDKEKEYREIFTKELKREKSAGVSLFGIQRDDMIIEINGKNSRLFASQGQQRSIVLTLKIAEGEVIREIFGEYPVFLFDDVLSELDGKRKKYITENMGKRQIIITSCEKEIKDFYDCKKIEVKAGEYSYTKEK